ncbi:MAG: hypothetical protein HY056_12270 [Proteobacteria bacterium]|nr:hypothetical protein [Pseudomonadota bacterium]
MSRIRSPNYPALSLPEAIKLVATIQVAEQHRTAPKEVVAKHIGYTTLHGLAKRMISAIENYGLLEEVTGDKVKVSPLAMSILFPSTPEEKQRAINDAAFKHPLFAAIKEEWEGSRPSDENLRVYLIRRKFAADALDRVIEVYKETMDLVTLESGVYPAQQGGQLVKSQEAAMQTTGNQGTSRLTPPAAPVPMRVSFNGDLLEVSAVLSDAAAVDRLVKALEANKALLPLTTKKEAAI